jgi:hypothetical protein
MNESEKFPSFSLEALRRRDRQEMSRLVEAFSGVVYRLGMKMLGDPQDAEDVLQSTFLKVFEALPTFEGPLFAFHLDLSDRDERSPDDPAQAPAGSGADAGRGQRRGR